MFQISYFYLRPHQNTTELVHISIKNLHISDRMALGLHQYRMRSAHPQSKKSIQKISMQFKLIKKVSESQYIADNVKAFAMIDKTSDDC